MPKKEKERPNTGVRSSFSPIRMIVGQKDPVKLAVEVANKDDHAKVYSVSVKLPFSFGFDKVGLMRENRKRVGYVNANSRVDVSFPIYGRYGLKPGLYDIDVLVRHHESDRYDKTVDEIPHTTQLRVE
jgi:uncharacterized membrane protein